VEFIFQKHWEIEYDKQLAVLTLMQIREIFYRHVIKMNIITIVIKYELINNTDKCRYNSLHNIEYYVNIRIFVEIPIHRFQYN